MRFGFRNGGAAALTTPAPALTLASSNAAPAPAPAPEPPKDLALQRPPLLDARVKLHQRIIDEFNLALLEKMTREELLNQLGHYVRDYVREEKLPLNQKELEAFVDEIIDEMIGLGPIEPLLKDPTISDILINTHEVVYVERFGKLEETNVQFKDEAHLLRIVNKIVAGVGRRVDESSPMVDARLPDGSRVNVAIRPVAVDGPLVSIRKFSKRTFSLDRLVEVGALDAADGGACSQAAVRGRISMIVSGGTGSGKTTMLNALSGFISPSERLITIEDAAELQLQQPHVAAPGDAAAQRRRQGRNPAARTRQERAAHAARPHHRRRVSRRGSLRHAAGHEHRSRRLDDDDPRQHAARRADAPGADGRHGRPADVAEQHPRPDRRPPSDVIVQLQRLSDGKRRVVSVSEITGMEGDVIQMQEIFKFVKVSTEADGSIIGHHVATGIRPRFLTDLAAMGVTFPASTFDPGRQM